MSSVYPIRSQFDIKEVEDVVPDERYVARVVPCHFYPRLISQYACCSPRIRLSNGEEVTT